MTTTPTVAPTPRMPAHNKGEQPPTYYKTLAASGFAPVNGLEMYYEIHGSGTGTPLVTIHGFAGLANVFPTLIRNRQLIAVEMQGHGHTPDIDRPLTFEQEAEDVAALMKYLEIDQADVFGESFGGIVAVLLALHHPTLVRRVVTYASGLGKFEVVTRPESLAEFMTLTPEHPSVQFQRESYQRIAPDPTQWPALFMKYTRMGWKGLSPDDLKSIKAPVLIAGGDHDVLGPRVEHHVENARLIPNGQLAIVPDAGHFVLNDEPEKLLPIVAAFLDQPISAVPFATTLSGYHPGETR
jgi:pimeloyl-ACP methyl ester carboxylesterase